SGYLKRAQDIVDSNGSLPTVLTPLLQIADTLPVRGGIRQVSDEVDLTRMQTALRNRDAWTAQLRDHADEDPLTAYLWLSFNCAYVPAGQQAVGEWTAQIPAWRETPLIGFKAAVCRGFSRAPFTAILDADA